MTFIPLTRLALLSLLLAASAARAAITLAPPWQDGAVVQRDRALPVWGRAEPGERLTISFAGQTVGATAARDGRWIVYLDPVALSADPAELTVVGKSETRTVRELVVGDVWLVAGGGALARPAPSESAAGGTTGLVRFFTVTPVAADTPADTVAGTWSRTGTGATAIATLVAQELHRRLQVPIGVIEATATNAPLEAWLSPAALADRGITEGTTAPANPSGYRPAALFNGTLHPLLPAALRGVLWSADDCDAAAATTHAVRFESLIDRWRDHLGAPELPFLWLQAPPSAAPAEPLAREFARLREAQDAARARPATGEVITLDLARDETREAARRVVLLARDLAYGLPVDTAGPRFARADREGPALRVHFTHADNGLTAGGKPLQAFEIAGPDRVFHPATARIERNTVLVSSPQVKEPLALRYAWFNAPEANLFNGAGLPASPFRTDDW